MRIREIKQEKKGKLLICTDEMVFPLYEKEAASWQLTEGGELDAETWNRLCRETLNKRVIRRAMFLLEKMDRTEFQLRRKLRDNHYPEELINVAVDYVKSFHYVDDLRYAENYIRFHQSDKSRLQLRTALQQRGVSSDLIAQAMEQAYEDHEEEMIRRFLDRKQYDPEHMDRKEKSRIYQYLVRKGFSNSQIMRQMDLT